MFTPQLLETYHRVRENGNDFEVIFVSSDRYGKIVVISMNHIHISYLDLLLQFYDVNDNFLPNRTRTTGARNRMSHTGAAWTG